METEVFTVQEVAQYLRTEPSIVTRLLESGQIVGFRVENEWRVLGAAIIDFLKKRMEVEQLRVLKRALSDPKMWALEARRHPDFLRMLECKEFPEDSFGNFLKKGLSGLEAQERSDNVVDFQRRDDDDQ